MIENCSIPLLNKINKELLSGLKISGSVNFMDIKLSFLLGRPIIDILKIDDYLEPPDGTSLKECIINNYGQEIFDFIQKYI
jgi:hypothetical protein